MFVFFREALTQSGAKRQGGRTPLVPGKDAKWPVPARVKPCSEGRKGFPCVTSRGLSDFPSE